MQSMTHFSFGILYAITAVLYVKSNIMDEWYSQDVNLKWVSGGGGGYILL